MLFRPRPPSFLDTYSLSLFEFVWKLPVIVSIFLVLVSISSSCLIVQSNIPIVVTIIGRAKQLWAVVLFLALSSEFQIILLRR